MNDACSIAEFCEGGRRDHDLEGSLDSAITAGIASAKPAGDIADPDEPREPPFPAMRYHEANELLPLAITARRLWRYIQEAAAIAGSCESGSAVRTSNRGGSQ